MDRRSFFRSAIDKGSKTAVKAIDTSVNKQASHWLRPPFALNELEFLLSLYSLQRLHRRLPT